MKLILFKLALSLLGDEKTRKKLMVAVLSVVVGLFGMMCLPFIVLHSMNEIGVPEISTSAIDQTELMANIDKEKTAELEVTGQTIADTMSVIGLQEQTIKAQLTYLSFFEDREITDFSQYAQIFSCSDDRTLIDCLNETYNLHISYEDFMRSNAIVMNATINPYLFTNTAAKNASDLAAWSRNAYVSGWGFESGARGEMNPECRYRCADNVGLLMGYLNYHPDEKLFSNDYDTLFYTEQGGLDTMPDVAGIGMFNDEEFGVYIGNDEVIFCSESVGHAEKTMLACGIWTSWCTFDVIAYPQEVWDAVQALQPEEPEKNILPLELLNREFQTDIFKLNMFAERLETMTPAEHAAYKAVLKVNAVSDFDELLQMTYNLGSVPVIKVSCFSELGTFAVEQEILPEIENCPAELLEYLDAVKLSRLMVERNKGMFIDDYYCEPEMYKKLDIHIEIGNPESCFFRLLLAPGSGDKHLAEWVSLPCEDPEFEEKICLQ